MYQLLLYTVNRDRYTDARSIESIFGSLGPVVLRRPSSYPNMLVFARDLQVAVLLELQKLSVDSIPLHTQRPWTKTRKKVPEGKSGFRYPPRADSISAFVTRAQPASRQRVELVCFQVDTSREKV